MILRNHSKIVFIYLKNNLLKQWMTWMVCFVGWMVDWWPVVTAATYCTDCILLYKRVWMFSKLVSRMVSLKYGKHYNEIPLK